jgi:excisionase family DNA binding protein
MEGAMPGEELTVREAASLADVPVRAVNKHIETRVMTARKSGGTRRLPKEAVMFLRTVCSKNVKDLPRKHKKVIWSVVRKLHEPGEVEVFPGMNIDLGVFADEHWEAAKRYVRARAEYLVADPDILGGTPVIKGTRITVYAVHGRLKGGESLDDLVADYPDMPREAFEVAEFFARSNPLRGRPAGLPSH